MAPGGESGAHARVTFRWEDNGYAQSPTDSTPKAFGGDAFLDTAEGGNALRRVMEPGTRFSIDKLATIFDGAWGVQFLVTSPWWLRALLGSPALTDNADGTFTYDYDATAAAYPQPDSLRITEGNEKALAERDLIGCLVTQARVDVEAGEQGDAVVTLSGPYASESIDTSPTSTADLTAQATSSLDTMSFVDASLSLGGSVEGYVMSMTANIDQPLGTIPEMGSRTFIDYRMRHLEPTFDFEEARHGTTDDYERLYGGSSATSPQSRVDNEVALDMTFDNGKAAGSGQNVITLSAGGALRESYDEAPFGNPREDVDASIVEWGDQLTASATNEVSAEP